MHYIDSKEEAWRQLHKNVASNIEQVLVATSHKAPTIRPPTCLPLRKLYKLDEPDTQDTVGEARTNSSVMYSYEPPHMAKQKQDDQLEHTYSSYVRIRDVALKTCQKRWMIGRSGERGLCISVLAARADDDDDILRYCFIFYARSYWIQIFFKQIYFTPRWMTQSAGAAEFTECLSVEG